MSPYIVTTPCSNCGGPEGYPSDHAVGCPLRTNPVRHAVATLDEARELVWRSITSDTLADVRPVGSMSDAIGDLPEAGGTVGPLPDGTVIEVEAVLIENLVVRGGLRSRYVTAARHADTAMSDDDVIDAYNAKQASRA